MQEKRRKQEKTKQHPLYVSILLLMIAVAGVTAATMAWLSIADSTKVRSMSMDVTSGVSLRFDLDPHSAFEEYVRTLNFTQIAARVQEEQGFSMQDTPLQPVTTTDFTSFAFEDGTLVRTQSGAYLEFVLHFMSTKDMIVHLSSASSGNQAGTAVASSNVALPGAMRISFTADDTTAIYSPGMDSGSTQLYAAKLFGLPSGADMVYDEDNALFSLTANEDKAVLVHVWLEGTDPACTDALKGADYSISLRFEGTDLNHQQFDEEPSRTTDPSK